MWTSIFRIMDLHEYVISLSTTRVTAFVDASYYAGFYMYQNQFISST